MGPAYCYIAKVPLYVGEQWERLRGNAPANRGTESSQPSLTDSGVWLLIIGQHLALCGAAFYFILAISRFFWVRLALALTWASNALFYTFAHCVGSETLGMILLVLLVVKALRLIRRRCESRWIDWYVFAIALCLCLLSRHVNSWLTLLLPAAFLLSWARNRALGVFASGDRQGHSLRRPGSRNLRQAAIAMAIGIACLAVANSSTRALARKTKLHPHSRIGFTFLWRLHFLKSLSPESRVALLRKVTARTHSAEARKLIALLEQVHEEGADLSEEPFMQRAVQLLFPPGEPVPWEKLDRALNEMAFAFLLPPTPEHLHAAQTEFAAALRTPVTAISFYLFNATAYYFQHKDKMPECAELVTFRRANADQIRLIPFQHFYFRLWQGLSYNRVLVIWFISLLGFVVVARRKKVEMGEIAAFGIALVSVGLLMVVSTCLLVAFGARYGLPMWELFWLSLFILIGGTADLFCLLRARAVRPAEKIAGVNFRAY